ncbi:MAG: hypothetical protein ACLQB1_33295 [Streptosporangiaceae bacterium]
MTDGARGDNQGASEAENPVEELREIIHEAQARMAKYLDEGQHLDPEKVVRQDVFRITVLSGGKSPWVQEVGGSHPRKELENVAAECELEIVDYVPLPPAVHWIRPRQSLIAPSDFIHVGLFIRDVAEVWVITKALDHAQRMISNAWKRNARYWEIHTPHGFWFVVSIWNSADRYWAVIALDINPSLPDQSSSLLSAYNAIMRFTNRRAHRKPVDHGDDSANSARAVLATVHDGQISRCRTFPNIEEAIGRLGNVHVVSSGGPLEALWVARHPRSSLGLRICKTLQENPNRCFTLRNLALISGCSSTTAYVTINELASMGAPVYRQSEFGWVFEPGD